MQINRLFQIVYILLDKKTVTAKELAGRFEVSTRTIYRDVETLSVAGIPVYMSKGKGGGVSLLPDFVLNKAVLTDEEKNDILSSLKAVNAINFSETDNALKKLGSLFGESNADWIEVDFSSWYNSDSDKCTFNTLKTAVLSRQVITFTYASGKGEKTKRDVEALKLCFKGGAWYLYGYCRKKEDFRFFKLKRMKDIFDCGELFQRKSPEQIFNSDNEFKEEYIPLKLKISPQMAFRVYDEFDNYETCDDGSFIATINFPKGKWIFNYITSFGSHCEILEPISVRQEYIKELEKISNNYS